MVGSQFLHLQQELWSRRVDGADPPGFTYNTPPGPNRVRPTFSPTMTPAQRERARAELKAWKALRDSDMAERRRESEHEEAMLRAVERWQP